MRCLIIISNFIFNSHITYQLSSWMLRFMFLSWLQIENAELSISLRILSVISWFLCLSSTTFSFSSPSLLTSPSLLISPIYELVPEILLYIYLYISQPFLFFLRSFTAHLVPDLIDLTVFNDLVLNVTIVF